MESYSFNNSYFIVTDKVIDKEHEISGSKSLNTANEYHVISGYVRSAKDQMPLIGVAVLFDSIGVVSDTYGRFSLELLERNYAVSTSYLGWDAYKTQFDLSLDTVINIELFEKTTDLEEVVCNNFKR